ncbi:MAG: glycosyltransferase family 39 protein [Gammaproteobacteria bacterium]|nr:glycosyltransferase family 39 protein [Gammaproteobacteria bacterium]
MPSRTGLISRKSYALGGLLFIALLVWFSNLEYRHLVKTDEGRYAEISREMVQSGDWLTPRLNGLKYFEKPPLQYWMTATAYTVFGEHQWTSRLWAALTGLGAILLVFFTGRRLFGADAGLYGALALGSGLAYVLVSHINTLDMGLTFFMTLGLCGLLQAQHPAATARGSRVWMHIAWAALAGAVLSKGLIGVVLPGAVVVAYKLLNRDWSLLKRLHLISGSVLLLLITAPWFIAVSLANPEFFQFFFIHEHFARFLTTVHRRDEPVWYFVPLLLFGTLPWTIPMLDALVRAWKHGAARDSFSPLRFLTVWSVFIFLFFSASHSKLPSYIAPILPALALLTGEHLSRLGARRLFWYTVPLALFAAVSVWLGPHLIEARSEEVKYMLFREFKEWVTAATLIWLASALLGLYLLRRARIRPALITLAAGALLAWQVVITGHNEFAPSNSAYHIAQQIKPWLRDDAPVYIVGMYDQTLPFYLQRTLTLVAYQDELAFGISQEPEKWVPDLATFEQIWRAAPYALAVVNPELYPQLVQRGLPMQLIAEDTRRIVVRTPGTSP